MSLVEYDVISVVLLQLLAWSAAGVSDLADAQPISTDFTGTIHLHIICASRKWY